MFQGRVDLVSAMDFFPENNSALIARLDDGECWILDKDRIVSPFPFTSWPYRNGGLDANEQCLYRANIAEGEITISINPDAEYDWFWLSFTSWDRDSTGAVIAEIPSSVEKPLDFTAAYDPASGVGVVAIICEKERYFCKFKAENIHLWSRAWGENTSRIETTSWIHHELESGLLCYGKKGYRVEKGWIFPNHQTGDIWFSMGWKRKAKSRFWHTRMDRLATHFRITKDDDIHESGAGGYRLPYKDSPRGFLLKDELLPHSITLSPNRKKMFHVKQHDDVIQDVQKRAGMHWIDTFSFLRTAHPQVASFLLWFVCMLPLLTYADMGYSVGSKGLFVFYAATTLALVLITLPRLTIWCLNASIANISNTFRFHGKGYGILDTKISRYEHILDIALSPSHDEILLVLSTDGIHCYDLKKGETSPSYRLKTTFSRHARFCPSASEHQILVLDQRGERFYETMMFVDAGKLELRKLYSRQHVFQKLREPDELGRRFLAPLDWNLSIDCIQFHLPNFSPSISFQPFPKDENQTRKILDFFGIDDPLDLDIWLDGQEWSPMPLRKTKGREGSTVVRGWGDLWLDSGALTRKYNQNNPIWTPAIAESHGLPFYGAPQSVRKSGDAHRWRALTQRPEILSPPRYVTGILLANMEPQWRESDIADGIIQWGGMRDGVLGAMNEKWSSNGLHQEDLASTLARAMAQLYPPILQSVRVEPGMIPNLIEQYPDVIRQFENTQIDVITTTEHWEKKYAEPVSLDDCYFKPSNEQIPGIDLNRKGTITFEPFKINWAPTSSDEEEIGVIEDKNNPDEVVQHLFHQANIFIRDAHQDMLGYADTVLPLMDYANILAELILLESRVKDSPILTEDQLSFYIHNLVHKALHPMRNIIEQQEPVYRASWAPLIQQMPMFRANVRRLEHQIHYTGPTMETYHEAPLDGSELELFVFERLLALVKEEQYTAQARVVEAYIRSRVDLLGDYLWSMQPFTKRFNDRVSLSMSDSNNWTIELKVDLNPATRDFYGRFFDVNHDSHLRLISNVDFGIVSEENQRIELELDIQKLLVKSVSYPAVENGRRAIQQQLGLDQEALIFEHQGKYISPNLEDLLFALAEEARKQVSIGQSPPLLPPISHIMVSCFGEQLQDIFYRLWMGCDQRTGDAQTSSTELYSFEEDAPAVSYMLMDDIQATQNRPKQPSLERSHGIDAWHDMRTQDAFSSLRETARNIRDAGFWVNQRASRQHMMMHGDLYPSNILLGTSGKLYLCDFSDTVYRRDGAVEYRRDWSEETQSEGVVSSQFFATDDPPRVNAMSDLAWFIATLLLKVPFEPNRNAFGDDVKDRLRERWNNLPDEEVERSQSFRECLEEELNIALKWADDQLKFSCNLVEGRGLNFKNHLKAMVFDRCLRLMAFQYARNPNIADWPYAPDDVAACFRILDSSVSERLEESEHQYTTE